MAKKQLKNCLKNYLFTGILVTAPLTITLYIIWILVHYIDTFVGQFLPKTYNPQTYFSFPIPFLGVIVLLVLLVLIGMLTIHVLGARLPALGKKMITHIPLVSGLYTALHKIFETLLGTGKESAFRTPVLIEYPRKGLWTIAFITGPVCPEIQATQKEPWVSVFVPTTPNPTSGFFLFIPKKDTRPLDLSVEDAFKMVLSTGIVGPQEKTYKAPSKK